VRQVPLTTAKFPIPNEKTIWEIIYTRGEADRAGIHYKEDWKEAVEGDWFLTTDGYVIKCLRRGKAGPTTYVRTCIGTFSITGKVCDTTPRKSRYTFSGRSHWSPHVSKARCGKKEQKFCDYITTKLYTDPSADLFSSAYEAFRFVWPGTAHNVKPATWQRYASNVLQRPHVKREIAKYMGDPAADVNDKWLMEEGLNAYRQIDLKDGVARLKGLNELMKLRKNVGGDLSGVRPDDLDDDEVGAIEQERQKGLRGETDAGDNSAGAGAGQVDDGDTAEPIGGNDRENDLLDDDDDLGATPDGGK
jgi:hypothetical protein